MQVSLRSTGRGKAPVATRALSADPLWEFQGYEFGWVRACVGYRARVVGGEPFVFAGFEVGGLAFHAADVEIGDGHEQMRGGVIVPGDYSVGLEFEFGDADAVFYEEDLLGAAWEDFQGAVFILGGVLFLG
jgi:hypothetical protein